MTGASRDTRGEAAAVLGFVAARLGALGPRIERIEAHAAHMVAASPGDRERMMALQDLDLIRQELEDLARLSDAAGRAPAAGGAALGSVLKLAALRDGLAHRTEGAAGPPDPGGGSPAAPAEFFTAFGEERELG
jgi:hypothetical protein